MFWTTRMAGLAELVHGRQPASRRISAQRATASGVRGCAACGQLPVKSLRHDVTGEIRALGAVRARA
jgi:hypothetical protein